MQKKNDIEKFFIGITKIPKFDNLKASQARELQKQLTKPVGSLGKLEELAIWMAGWQRKITDTTIFPQKSLKIHFRKLLTIMDPGTI